MCSIKIISISTSTAIIQIHWQQQVVLLEIAEGRSFSKIGHRPKFESRAVFEFRRFHAIIQYKTPKSSQGPSALESICVKFVFRNTVPGFIANYDWCLKLCPPNDEMLFEKYLLLCSPTQMIRFLVPRVSTVCCTTFASTNCLHDIFRSTIGIS